MFIRIFFPSFRFKFWKNKSIFLFNIVVADFLLVVCLPVKIYNYQHNKRRSPNDMLCRIMHFMLFLNRGASIAFLVVLSIDRYFNVVRLGRRNFVKILKKTPQVSIVIWLLLFPLTIPTMLGTFECCNSHGRQVETKWHDVMDTLREVTVLTSGQMREKEPSFASVRSLAPQKNPLLGKQHEPCTHRRWLTKTGCWS